MELNAVLEKQNKLLLLLKAEYDAFNFQLIQEFSDRNRQF